MTAPLNPASAAKLADFLPTPETRAAWLAVGDLAEQLAAGDLPNGNPLVLHGPPGTGKSHLANGLAATVPVAEVTPATDLARTDPSAAVRTAALWVVDDLHRLPERGVELFDRLLDGRLRRRKAVCLTTNESPSRLSLPPRVISRLSGGLVVGLDAPSPESRRMLLDHLTRDRSWQLAPEAMAWLAESATGVRSLLGTAQRLDAVAKTLGRPTIELADLQRDWADDGPAPQGEAIVQAVASYFATEPKLLRTVSRRPALVWPTQLAMALVKRATELSTDAIGEFFGGRDASTVRRAVRNVARKVADDPAATTDWRRLLARVGRLTAAGVAR